MEDIKSIENEQNTENTPVSSADNEPFSKSAVIVTLAAVIIVFLLYIVLIKPAVK